MHFFDQLGSMSDQIQSLLTLLDMKQGISSLTDWYYMLVLDAE